MVNIENKAWKAYPYAHGTWDSNHLRKAYINGYLQAIEDQPKSDFDITPEDIKFLTAFIKKLKERTILNELATIAETTIAETDNNKI